MGRKQSPGATGATPQRVDSERLVIRPVVTVGLLIVFAFFGAFGGWAALAPLDSAVIARGVVKVAGERKVVQHLEGGIVADLHVAEGDRVEAAQILLRFDDTQARARLDLFQGRLVSRQALAARLAAERDMLPEIIFPETLTAAGASPSAREAVAAQTGIFRARKRALEGQTIILNQRKLQTQDEIVGLEAIIASQDKLVAAIEEEAADLEKLLKRGLTTRERLLGLRRRLAELEGERGSNVAAVTRARKAITEIEQQILALSTERLNEAVAELSQVETELFDLQQQVRASDDVLRRAEIRAPVSGTIVGLRVHTHGGVVQPGEALMEIVPEEGALILEVQVRPEDVNLVSAGQTALVRVSAFNLFDTPALVGTVLRVSADRLTDERTGQAYFNAILAISDEELARLQGQQLIAGMSAEAMIQTGTHTLVDYITEPITGSFRRALRED